MTLPPPCALPPVWAIVETSLCLHDLVGHYLESFKLLRHSLAAYGLDRRRDSALALCDERVVVVRDHTTGIPLLASSTAVPLVATPARRSLTGGLPLWRTSSNAGWRLSGRRLVLHCGVQSLRAAGPAESGRGLGVLPVMHHGMRLDNIERQGDFWSDRIYPTLLKSPTRFRPIRGRVPPFPCPV